MANNENLTPVKKGQVLNPNGRPKGSRNRQTIYRELLELAAFKKVTKKQSDILAEDGELLKQESVADQVAASVVISALSGDIAAAREVMDSAHGKLTDKLDNLHSFTAMGRVEAKLSTGEGGKGEQETVALSFDVGNDPLHEKEEDE